MLESKQNAPALAVSNQNDELIRLSDYREKKHVVLYFYPKDDTPGCTIEANEFTALAEQFSALDTVIMGVSKDDCASHRAFIDKYGLQVELLADIDGNLCQSYGVWQEKEKNGVKKMGVVRSTFIINKEGVLVEALYGVSPDGHAQAMLDRIQLLQAG